MPIAIKSQSVLKVMPSNLNVLVKDFSRLISLDGSDLRRHIDFCKSGENRKSERNVYIDCEKIFSGKAGNMRRIRI